MEGIQINTKEIAAEYRLTHWAQIMKERNESGLSVRAFCKEAGFHENIYYYWQRKLREAACGQLAGKQAGAGSLVPQGFAEAKLREEPIGYPALETSCQLRIEAMGVQISAGVAYPVDKLAALIRELGRRC